MTTSIEKAREKLIKERDQKNARIKLLDAKIKKRKREAETRIKIIYGGTVLAHMRHDAEFRNQINTLFQKYGRKQDKAYIAKHGGDFSTHFNLASGNQDDVNTVGTASPQPKKQQ